MNITTFLACYGLTFFLAESIMFERPREWLCENPLLRELFSCWFCLGFWSSVIINIIISDPFILADDWVYLFETLVVNGFAGATFVFAFNTLLELMESLYDNDS